MNKILVAVLFRMATHTVTHTQPHTQSQSHTHTHTHSQGSMNKILVAVAGIVLFHEAPTMRNMASISLGLLAGVIFVFAKGYTGGK